MGLKWFEQIGIVDSLRNTTRQKADTAFAAYNRKMQALEQEQQVRRDKEQERQTTLYANLARAERVAKAERNIQTLNQKLLKLDYPQTLPISADNIERELSSGFGWASSVLQQAYTDRSDAIKKEILKAATQDVKRDYDKLIAPRTKDKRKWKDLSYKEQQEQIDERFWVYMRKDYPEYFGTQEAAPEGMTPEELILPSQPEEGLTMMAQSEVPELRETNLPAEGYEVSEGIRIMPDLSVVSNNFTVGHINPQTGVFEPKTVEIPADMLTPEKAASVYRTPEALAIEAVEKKYGGRQLMYPEVLPTAYQPLSQILQEGSLQLEAITPELRQSFVDAFPFGEQGLDTVLQHFQENPETLRATFLGVGRTKEAEQLARALYKGISEQQLKDLFDPNALVVEQKAREMAELPQGGGKWGTFTAGVGDLVANVGGTFRWLGNDGIADKLTRYGQFMQVQAAPVPFEPEEFTWRSMFDPRFLTTYGLRMLPTTLVLAATSVLGFAAVGGVAKTVSIAAQARGIVGLRSAGVMRTIIQGFGGAALSRPLESALEAGGAYDQARMKGYSHEQANEIADRVFNENLKLMGWDATQLAAAFMPMGSIGSSAIGAINKGLVKTAQIGGKIFLVGLSEGGEEVYQERILKQAMGEPFDWADPETQMVFALGSLAGLGFGFGGDVLTRVTNRGMLEFTPEQKMLFDVSKSRYAKDGQSDQAASLSALADVVEKYPEVASLLKESAEKVAEEVKKEEADKIKGGGLRVNPAVEGKRIIPEGYKPLRALLEDEGNWAVISAEKDTQSKVENTKATKSLESILKRRNKEYYYTRGREKDSNVIEAGFLIRGMDELTANEIGKQFRQDSVLVPRGILNADLSFESMDTSDIHYASEEAAFFTEVDMEGKTYKFSIPPKEGAELGHINRIGQQVTRAGFLRKLREAFPEIYDLRINRKLTLRESHYNREKGYAFIELGVKDLAKYATDPADQETLFRLVALHEIGHEMAKEGHITESLPREIAAWEWAIAKAKEYYLLSPNAGKFVEAFMAEAHPELGKGKLLNELRARGLISALIPDTVRPDTEQATHGWENVVRGFVQLESGKWEARLMGEKSKVILLKQEMDAKPRVKDFQSLERMVKKQKEIRYDAKTGKYMKVRKTITKVNKTNWDILPAPTRRLMALGARFNIQESDAISALQWAGLSIAQRSALKASAFTMPSTIKAIAAWNKMTISEREALVGKLGKTATIGALVYSALNKNEKNALRLAILTEQIGVNEAGKLEVRALGSQRMPIDPVQVRTAVDKLAQMIKLAKPIRSIEKGLKHEELSKRAGKMAEIWEQHEGQEAFEKGRAALKGALPTAEAEFTVPEITEEDITVLFNAIKRSPIWKPNQRFEQMHTATALTKVLAGQIPTDSEFVLLEKQFGSELVAAILEKRSLGAKAWEVTMDALNIPRALLSSWDLSAPLRQGALLVWGQPRQSVPALVDMVKAFGSEKFTIMVEESINSGKYAQLRRDVGLYIAPYRGEAARLIQREEAFMSKLARHIPLVKHSERAYVTYLNKLRADVFDSYAALWEGTEKATVENYKALAHAINVMSGRGDLPSFIKSGGVWMNALFFSPRFIMSRVMLPVELVRTSPAVRSIMARNIVSFVLANMAMYLLYYLGTKDTDDPMALEVDARSTDFGKIKIGNTRIDYWGGFQPYARFIVQLITGTRKYTTTGEFAESNRLDLIERFVRSKLSPAAGLVADILKGETFLGDEFSLEPESVKEQAYQRLVPMFVQDLVDAVIDTGAVGIPLALPSMFGTNMQTYGGYTITRDDLDGLARDFFGRDWNQLSSTEQEEITDWLGGLK